MGGPDNVAEVSKTLGNLYWRQYLLMGNIYEISETETVLDRNLNFRIKVFTLGLANDLHICEKNKKSYRTYCVQFDLKNNAISKLREESQCKSITVRLTI